MIMIFTDRVGFPVLAFLLMFFLCFFTLKQNTEVLGDVKTTLLKLNENITMNSMNDASQRKEILDEIRRRNR